MSGETEIRWPPRFSPGEAPVHVVNRISGNVPAATAWDRLVRARDWPAIYANAKAVSLQGGGDRLSEGARFRWTTFGVALRSEVIEFEEERRISWMAFGTGVQACHAWVITPSAEGCDILTEETQHGGLARLGKLIFPKRMHMWHQRWLEALVA